MQAAVMRPQSGFGDYLTFPSLWEQAAALLHGLIQAHAFLDGNKRAAWISTVAFLNLNGFEVVNLKQRPMADYVEAIAKGEHELKATAVWLYRHAQAF
nr:type II toxin-antitoxin system death-on-curing family toxin [Frigoribacterium sp. CFBP 13712]